MNTIPMASLPTASPTALWPRTVVDGEFDRWVRAWPQKTRSSRCYRESFAGTTFGDETPLWYYVLKEAEVHSLETCEAQQQSSERIMRLGMRKGRETRNAIPDILKDLETRLEAYVGEWRREGVASTGRLGPGLTKLGLRVSRR